MLLAGDRRASAEQPAGPIRRSSYSTPFSVSKMSPVPSFGFSASRALTMSLPAGKSQVSDAACEPSTCKSAVSECVAPSSGVRMATTVSPVSIKACLYACMYRTECITSGREGGMEIIFEIQ